MPALDNPSTKPKRRKATGIGFRLRRPPEGRESLERIQRYPGVRAKWLSRTVRILSAEWGSYWRKDGAGYTVCRGEAWVLPFTEAYKATAHCGPEKGIQYEEV